MSRPSTFRQELFDEICLRISEGESLLSVCRSPGMPDKRTVLRWLNTRSELRPQYEGAQDIRAEMEFERILEIADNVEPDVGSVARARLQIDVRKWVLSRMKPKKYGKG